MRYPPLVPPRLCHTHVKVTLTGGLDIEGCEKQIGTYIGKCNLRRATKQTVSAEKRLVTIDAVALFPGDIAPEITHLTGAVSTVCNTCLEIERGDLLETENGDFFAVETGYVFPTLETELYLPIEAENGANVTVETGKTNSKPIFSETYHIARAVKECNPDGTVNYTRLELVL